MVDLEFGFSVKCVNIQIPMSIGLCGGRSYNEIDSLKDHCLHPFVGLMLHRVLHTLSYLRLYGAL